MTIALKDYKKLSSEIKTTILSYLVLSAITQMASFIVWKQSQNNLPILHVFTLLEFLIILRFYTHILSGTISQKGFIVISLVYSSFAIIDSLLIENIFIFNTLGRSVEALIFTFLAIYWFIKNISSEAELTAIEVKGVNYINSGFLIYFSGSVVLFSFSNIINQMAKPLSLNIWTLHTFLLVVLYVIITVGLWKNRAL